MFSAVALHVFSGVRSQPVLQYGIALLLYKKSCLIHLVSHPRSSGCPLCPLTTVFLDRQVMLCMCEFAQLFNTSFYHSIFSAGDLVNQNGAAVMCSFGITSCHCHLLFTCCDEGPSACKCHATLFVRCIECIVHLAQSPSPRVLQLYVSMWKNRFMLQMTATCCRNILV